MQDQELLKLLEKLRTEIETAPNLDEKALALLRDLDADIHAVLARSGAAPLQAGPSLLKQLQNAIDHLEITHPALTRALSDMLAILSNAGI